MFLGLRVAYLDVALQVGIIEGVQGLAQFQHHVIGDVDDGTDAAHAAALQALHHPGGCGDGRIDAIDDAATVARTGCGGQELDAARLCVCQRGRGKRWLLQRGLREGRYFTSNASQ